MNMLRNPISAVFTLLLAADLSWAGSRLLDVQPFIEDDVLVPRTAHLSFSPAGDSVYAAASEEDGLFVYEREQASGALGFLQFEARSARTSAVSPDGLPLRAQLQSASGRCWEKVFSSASRNEPSRFGARVTN